MTIQESEFCRYQYILKEQSKTDIAGAEEYAVSSLENEKGEAITVYGIRPDSRYLDTSKLSDLNGSNVLLSSSYYDKYQLDPGALVTLTEEFTADQYTFKAEGEYDYPASLAVFMTIDQNRGQPTSHIGR